MRKLLISGALISLAFLPSKAALTMAPAWNPDKVLVPSSKYTPGQSWSADAWIVNTNINYYGPQDRGSDVYNRIWGTPAVDSEGRNWYENDYVNTSGYGTAFGEYKAETLINWESKDAPFTTDRWIAVDKMGDIYLRRSFTLDAIPEGPVYLACGRDDAPSEWYINGTLVHSEIDGWDENARVLLTDEQKELLRVGDNLMAVHVHQNWGGAYADCGLYEAAGTIYLLPTKDNGGAWPCVYKLIGDNENIQRYVDGGCFALDADESDWTLANGPFSNSNDIFNTTYWNSDADAILIRRHFNLNKVNLESLKAGQGNAFVTCSYDEFPKVYLNGQLITSWDGWNDNDYANYILTQDDLNLLVEGDNVLAVSLQRGGGGGHIDYGFLWEVAADTEYQLRDDPTALFNRLADFVEKCRQLKAVDYASLYSGGVLTLQVLDDAIAYGESVYNKGITGVTEEELDEAVTLLESAYNTYAGENIKNVILVYAAVYELMVKETQPGADWGNPNVSIPLREALDMTVFANEFNACKDEGAFNAALTNLRTGRRMRGAVHTADIFPGQAPAAGQFYLYNVGQKLWLQGGSDWGAHAALGNPGIELTLSDAGDGTFIIQTGLHNGGAPHDYLTISGYCDGPSGDAGHYKFTSVEGQTNVFNISRVHNGIECFMTWNPYGPSDAGNANEAHVSTNVEGVDASNPNSQWKLVTREERLALIAEASETNPVDLTFMLNRPGFSQRETFNPYWWPIPGGDGRRDVGEFAVFDQGGNHGDFAMEAYDRSANANFSYQLEDAPAGVYKVCIQGFYRNGSSDTQAGAPAAQYAHLFAGNNTSLLPNITDYSNLVPGEGAVKGSYRIPDSVWDSCVYFRNGLYNTYVTATVRDGYTLPIGVEKFQRDNSGDWIVVDNIRIYYYGPNASEEAVSNAPDPNAYKGN